MTKNRILTKMEEKIGTLFLHDFRELLPKLKKLKNNVFHNDIEEVESRHLMIFIISKIIGYPQTVEIFYSIPLFPNFKIADWLITLLEDIV